MPDEMTQQDIRPLWHAARVAPLQGRREAGMSADQPRYGNLPTRPSSGCCAAPQNLARRYRHLGAESQEA
jgi:hypothetical protein